MSTTGVKLRSSFAVALLVAACCSTIPESVRIYAGELPSRADGQYGLLDDPIKKQLVMKDSLLQCKIDLEDGKKEGDSHACKCSKSESADWTADCKDWLGSHTPTATSASAAPSTSASAAPSPGTSAGASPN